MKKIVVLILTCLITLPALSKDFHVTVLQWNIWQEGEMVKGGYDAIVNEIARLKPDFVTFSEVRNYHQTSFAGRIQHSLKAKGLTYYSFYSYDTGLLSKHPIRDTIAVFPCNQDHGSIHKLVASVKGVEFAVYTGHLDYLNDAYYNVLGYDGSTFKEVERPKSVAELLKMNDLSWRDDAIRIFINEAKHDLEKGRQVILGGDFNEPSYLDWTEETKDLYDHHGMIVPWTVSVLLQKAGYKDAYRIVHPEVLSYPGITYPAHNPDYPDEKITWAPKADERERIDYVCYQGSRLKPVEAKIFGPVESVAHARMTKENSKDEYILPLGVWPTDHKGVWVKFLVTRR